MRLAVHEGYSRVIASSRFKQRPRRQRPGGPRLGVAFAGTGNRVGRQLTAAKSGSLVGHEFEQQLVLRVAGWAHQDAAE